MSDTDLSGRIRQRREQLGLSQEELAARMGYRSKSSITKLEKGINDLPRAKLEELAAALDTTPAWLMGLVDLPCPPPGFEPLPEMVRVPLVGSIACGTPITAEQNIECYIGVPAAWHADFALTCHGSSMAPTICDGDIVCIRRQPEVEQGEIAAVRIGEEATLKHFHRQGDAVILLADNAAVCPPMIYAGSQLEEIQIEGRAVHAVQGLGHDHGLRRVRNIDGKLVGIGPRHPLKIPHRLVGQIGVVFLPAVTHAGQEVVLGQLTLQPEQLVFRRADEDVVVEQGTARIDRTAVFVTHLHIGGGEILEQRLPTTLAPGKLGIQAFSGADPVASCHTRSRKREHVPAYSLQVMTLANPRRTPLRATVSQNIHHYDYLFLRL